MSLVRGMFKNKNGNRNNVCGSNIRRLRLALEPHKSQRAFADDLQLKGLDLDKNAIQRIESGQRFVTDIELLVISDYLGVRCDELLRRKR